MKSLLDPTFKYVPSTSTNIRRTFARVRKQLAQQRSTIAVLPARDFREAVSNFSEAHLIPIRASDAEQIH